MHTVVENYESTRTYAVNFQIDCIASNQITVATRIRKTMLIYQQNWNSVGMGITNEHWWRLGGLNLNNFSSAFPKFSWFHAILFPKLTCESHLARTQDTELEIIQWSGSNQSVPGQENTFYSTNMLWIVRTMLRTKETNSSSDRITSLFIRFVDPGRCKLAVISVSSDIYVDSASC